jgi:iron complex outermembrane receptor protein
MRLVRFAVPIFALTLLAPPLAAQDTTGTIVGTVTDVVTKEPLANVSIRVDGTTRQTTSGPTGSYILTLLPAGNYRVRALRIGFAQLQQDVVVSIGQTARADFAMEPQAALIDPVVVTGYGTQRREAITSSVSTIDPATADVGVMSNVNQMMQGRAAGVDIIQNNGEPGAGAQVRIRGGTSISASNEPLYVIDGVPVTNVDPEAAGVGISGEPPLPRSPLNLLNPSDIGSITILKDASATAIYGSRGANGVVLIETKKGSGGAGTGTTIEYDTYVSSASPARKLNLLSGAEYQQFVENQIAAGNLDPSFRQFVGVDTDGDGTREVFNTNWEDAVTRSARTHNHNLSFAGGTDVTRYRASLNYMDQEGVALGSGLERIQGRISGSHSALDNRLRLGLNVTTSRVNNDYLSFNNGGGFEGGVFVNMAIFNPTSPIRVPTATGSNFYELGAGVQSIRNPVALAEQIDDYGNSSRTLGNATAALDIAGGLTASINVGIDQSDGIRRTYIPAASPVGQQWQGLARQVDRENASVTFQGQLSLSRQVGADQTLDVLGAYEFAEHTTQEFGAEAQNFTTDRFSFNSLGSGSQLVRPFSFRTDERWISFISRASWGFKEKYFITGVLRYDGRSAFAEGHKWAAFPAISGSWRISGEDFWNQPLGLSEFRLRAGFGVVGNPGVPPYASQITLESPASARYIFGQTPVVGFAPIRNPNPNLKFERTTQFNVALDYGLLNNRISGNLEYYVKNTSDLILEVDVAQPAPTGRRLENVGKVRNRGLELSLDALPISRPGFTWRAGFVFSTEHSEVVDLGPYQLINSGFISGEGQSGAVSQRVIPGEPLGTFWGPIFAGVDAQGRQLVQCASQGASDTLCVGGVMLATSRRAEDFGVIGNANPDFTIGFNSQLTVGKFDASFSIRGAFGQQVFNNTALVYGTKTKVNQGRNFLRDAVNDPIAIGEPAIFSSLWVEDASYLRLQNITVGFTFNMPRGLTAIRQARVYVSGDNLLLLTGYSGLDPEVHAQRGLGSLGLDYLSYPRPRTLTAGLRVAF